MATTVMSLQDTWQTKVIWICSALEALSSGYRSCWCNFGPAHRALMDTLQSVQPDDLDRILADMRAMICILDPCTSWLIKAARGELAEWVRGVLNTFLLQGRLLACSKETVVKLVLEKIILGFPTLLVIGQSPISVFEQGA